MRLVHDGTPIPQGRAKASRWGFYYPKTSKAHRQELVDAWTSQYRGEPLDGELEIAIFVVGPRVSSDPDNHAKMILDSLVDAGVITSDDCRVVAKLTVERQLHVPKSQRYTAVEIQPWRRGL